MNEEKITAELVTRILGWTVTPDRFVTSGRSWLPRWRFAPFARLDDAFRLLEQLTSSYTLEGTPDGTFAVTIRLDGRIGEAAGEPKARVITLAISRALGLEDSL